VKNKQFLELLAYQVRSNLSAETSRYALSYLWWIVEPALHLGILYVVFGIFFGGNQDPSFFPFLFCGLVPWFWFSKSVTNSLSSIESGKNIIRDVDIKKHFFPLVSVFKDTIKEILVFSILFILLILNGISPSIYWLQLIPLVLLQLLFITVISLFVAIIIPYFLDLKHFILTALQLAMFSAGTFYDYKTMPSVYHIFFEYNPITLLVNMYRDALLYQKVIEARDYVYILLFIVCIGMLDYFTYKKLDKDIPRVLYK